MKFSGVTIFRGSNFPFLPIDFEWALQQCSATALPVIVKINEYNNTDHDIHDNRKQEMQSRSMFIRFCRTILI